MKVLLDECPPKDLQRALLGHECQTAPKAGFAGKGNGELLTLAEKAGFQVLLTIDKGLPNQQNLTERKIAILILHAKSNKLADLLPHVPACLSALRSIKPGDVVKVLARPD
jgi:hypothetical protein